MPPGLLECAQLQQYSTVPQVATLLISTQDFFSVIGCLERTDGVNGAWGYMSDTQNTMSFVEDLRSTSAVVVVIVRVFGQIRQSAAQSRRSGLLSFDAISNDRY